MTENLSGRAMASSLDLVALNQLRSELEDSWESVGPRGAQSSASSSRSFFLSHLLFLLILVGGWG